MRKSVSWFQGNAQQGVFMKMGTLRPISKSGAMQSSSKKYEPKPEDERYFTVGESIIGEGQEVGAK